MSFMNIKVKILNKIIENKFKSKLKPYQVPIIPYLQEQFKTHN